ncbi:putative dehydrogenase [Maribacter spongiicola]|uniref:Putative dehydrogenase n=1 Tax=Maribacter spongiicola TaxID=1206753 RepID=A0A4R7K9G0_9FLAO|nr:Gfo/Idh/MocA family oxidoreductase [Maribacter spongiicola]TDT47352.1 putative dehydrogenase [Maribacter spongiicola]
MKLIKWGIIGCGNVAEVKSGPAFNKTENSELIGVMRRNGAKAKDFADRHSVPYWTDNADDLLNNDDINSIYIATPPSTHLEYALKALSLHKNVYLEKPMALTFKEAETIGEAVKSSRGKLSVAHYRRKLPAFSKVKELIDANAIGKILIADIQILQPKKSKLIANSEENWRLNPQVSGGGLFYDIAPHQIDLMYHYFGAFKNISGSSTSSNSEMVEDTVNGIIEFENGVQFRGIWNFVGNELYSKEQCIIYGTQGSISFSFYGDSIVVRTKDKEDVLKFNNPKHIQQPMIASVVSYFLGNKENPCAVEEGILVMKALEKLSGRQ